jgi:hypothetical protein
MTLPKGPELIVPGCLELIGLALIIRLWVKQTPRKVWKRVLWSVILVLPLFGVLAYGFMTLNLDEAPGEKRSSSLDGTQATNDLHTG